MLMNLRNGILLLLFGLFFPSLAFGQATTVSASDVSSKSYIQITDSSLRLNLRSIYDANQVVGTITRNDAIQLPDGFAEYDGNQINLERTLRNWEQKVASDSRFGALAPVQCGNTLCVPIKIAKTNSANLSGKSFAYISLHYMRDSINSRRYRSLRRERDLNTTVPDTVAVQTPPAATSGGEVTTSEPSASPAPTGTTEIMNCNNTVYRSRGFSNHSCIKNLSLKQKAELVMRDVLQINQWRTSPRFNLDPRVSACMAYRESGFAPNAKGGTPDWGMYQVIDSTARNVLRRTRAVTPGFQGISWTEYRPKMLRSTVAQADLHHSVMYHKAKAAGLLNSVTFTYQFVQCFFSIRFFA